MKLGFKQCFMQIKDTIIIQLQTKFIYNLYLKNSMDCLNCNRNIRNLRPRLVLFYGNVIHRKCIKVMNLRVQRKLWRRISRAADEFFDYINMPVINMGICNNMDQFSRLQAADLRQHMN